MSIGVVVADPRVLHENAVRNAFVQLPRTRPASRGPGWGKKYKARPGGTRNSTIDQIFPSVQVRLRQTPLRPIPQTPLNHSHVRHSRTTGRREAVYQEHDHRSLCSEAVHPEVAHQGNRGGQGKTILIRGRSCTDSQLLSAGKDSCHLGQARHVWQAMVSVPTERRGQCEETAAGHSAQGPSQVPALGCVATYEGESKGEQTCR